MKPMYNVDDIFARLMQGEKLEDIGNELANAMNAAQEKYTAVQKEAEEKREKARQDQIKAQRIATRRELLWDVLNALLQYADYTDYGKIVCDWMNELSDDDVAELDAQMIELLKTFEVLSQLNFDFNLKSVANKQPAVQKDTKKVDPDKALGDFIKMMGW